jgi:hypothetical protein
VRFSIILQEDYEIPDELTPDAVLLTLVYALRDYLRTHTDNTGIEVIPRDEYLTFIPLLEEGVIEVKSEIEDYLFVPAFVSLLEENKPAKAGIKGDSGLLVPAGADVAGKVHGPNLTVIVPERTEYLPSINELSALYKLLHTKYSLVETI